MSQPLDDYLSRVARELRSLPETVRENELREVRFHLEQLIEDSTAQGQSRSVATQSALATFGSARGVRIGMRDVLEGQETGWKPWVTAFVRGFLFWIAAMYALVFGFTVGFRFNPHSVLFIAESVSIPVLAGAIHALYLGRRAWIMSAAIYLLLWTFEQATTSHINIFSCIWSFALGVGGAMLMDFLLRRRRYAILALATGLRTFHD